MTRLSSRFCILASYSIVITILYAMIKVFDKDSNLLTVSVKSCCSNEPQRTYDRKSKIVFIGGFPRSGTTVFKSMIERHPSIKCGKEAILILDLLKTINDEWTGKQKISYSNSVAQFILMMLTKRPAASPILCSKCPMIGLHYTYLHTLFPGAKFLLLIRDGRAVAHSNVQNHFFQLDHYPHGMSHYEHTLTEWNGFTNSTLEQCFLMGRRTCLIVFYELFVNDTEFLLKEIAKFLEIEYLDWAKRERVTWKSLWPYMPQLKYLHGNLSHDISNSSFYNWLGNDGDMLRSDVQRLAPMLNILGYDTINRPPDYSVETMHRIYENAAQMQQSSQFY